MKKVSKNLMTGLIGLSLIAGFSGCGSDSENNTTKDSKVSAEKTTNGIIEDGDLNWQDDNEVITRSTSYKEYRDYCPQLNLGGYDDWRLPTVKEYTDKFNNIKNNFDFDFSDDNYIFYTSGEYFKDEVGHSIHMYNAANNLTPLYRVYIIEDDPFPWGIRCVRNTTK